MNKKLDFIILVGSLALVLVLAWVGYNALAPKAPPENLATQSTAADGEGYPAPDFTVYDSQGRAHSLSDFRGKPVILNFWASWCGPCKSEMPEFQAAYDSYGRQIHFLMVNLTDGYQETQQTAQAFLDGGGYSFPVYFDTQQAGAMAYGVTAVPVTYFIDARGNLVANASGMLTESTLAQGIALLLGE